MLDFTLLYCTVKTCVLGGESHRQKFSLEVKQIVTGKCFSGAESVCLSSKLEVVDEFLAALTALN